MLVLNSKMQFLSGASQPGACLSFRIFLVQGFKKPLLLSWFTKDPITSHLQYIYRAFWNLPLYILILGLKGPLSNALLQFLPFEDERHFCEGLISAWPDLWRVSHLYHLLWNSEDNF